MKRYLTPSCIYLSLIVCSGYGSLPIPRTEKAIHLLKVDNHFAGGPEMQDQMAKTRVWQIAAIPAGTGEARALAQYHALWLLDAFGRHQKQFLTIYEHMREARRFDLFYRLGLGCARGTPCDLDLVDGGVHCPGKMAVQNAALRCKKETIALCVPDKSRVLLRSVIRLDVTRPNSNLCEQIRRTGRRTRLNTFASNANDAIAFVLRVLLPNANGSEHYVALFAYKENSSITFFFADSLPGSNDKPTFFTAPYAEMYQPMVAQIRALLEEKHPCYQGQAPGPKARK